MLKKKKNSSLTFRIFLITFAVIFAVCGITFAFISYSTPISYSSVMEKDMQKAASSLIDKLEQTSSQDLEGTKEILKEFSIRYSVGITMNGQNGDSIYTNDFDSASPEDGQEKDGSDQQSISSTTAMNFRYHDSEAEYILHLTTYSMPENQVNKALWIVAPYLVLVIFFLSAGISLFYSRYLTKPIVNLSKLSQKMADLDFTYRYQSGRQDEIGTLGRNLDHLSQSLSETISELQSANCKLQGDIQRQQEMEAQRLAFFSAASHELKTPITILKGQINGMLDGISVYQDRDLYLAKALAVTNRMEKLVLEILSVARMGSPGFTLEFSEIDLSLLLRNLLAEYEELMRQKNLNYDIQLAEEIRIAGNEPILKKAISNVLSNAVCYSPEGAVIRLQLSLQNDRVLLTVENEPAHIPEQELPHLFEPFYRVEQSRNRSTGGSGLGLYLVHTILKLHKAGFQIENTPAGVKFTISF